MNYTSDVLCPRCLAGLDHVFSRPPDAFIKLICPSGDCFYESEGTIVAFRGSFFPLNGSFHFQEGEG